MKYLFYALAMILLALSAVWLGAYFNHLYPFGHWASFPIFITAFAMFVVTGALACFFLAKSSERS